MGTLETWERVGTDAARADPLGAAACCADHVAFASLVRHAPAVVAQVRILPVASMFDRDLQRAAASLPFAVATAVVTPEATAGDVADARLGDVLVFHHQHLVGRLRVTLPVTLLTERLQRILGATPVEPRDAGDEQDPFAILGVSPTATFAQMRAAWRRRLAEYHPDRFATAGEKIRQVALAETQRLNAAFRTLAASQRFGRA